MTDWVTWFRYQLKASADGFEWALTQIPAAFHDQLPPDPGYLGTWSPLRHIWHVTGYERHLVIPSMRQWLADPGPLEEDWFDDDASWAKVTERSAAALTAEFHRIRLQQIDFLDRLTTVDWTAPRETLWGAKPLSMVVTKTFQHTYEHGDTLLRMGLWWEETLKEEAEKQQKTNS